MILAVVIACLAAAFGLLAFAVWERSYRGPRASGQIAALVLALLLLLLAAAVAIIEEKVASADNSQVKAVDSGQAASADTEPARDASDRLSGLAYPLSAAELDDFAGTTGAAHGSPGEPLCLVQYYDHDIRVGAGRSYKWWTSCVEAEGFKTISDVRAQLALPPAWGERNAVAIACVPAGANLAYLSGQAAAVRSNGRRYRGGALQFRVLSFDPEWIVARRPLPTPPKQLPALERRSCPR